MAEDDPATIAIAAVAGSAAISAAGSVKGGIDAQSASAIQAQQLERQAQLEKQAAGAEIAKNDANAGKVIASGVAATGAAGVTPDSVSPVLNENFTETKIRDMYTRYSGQLAASNDLYAAKNAKYQGNQALWTGFFGGAQSVLGAVGQGAQIRMQSGGSGVGNLSVGSGSGAIH